MVTRTLEGLECRFGRTAPLTGVTAALLSLTVVAAPPLGYRTEPAVRPMAEPVDALTSDPGSGSPTTPTAPSASTGGTPTSMSGSDPIDPGNEGYVECTAEAPIRLAPNACADQATVDAINGGWNLTINPDDSYAWTPPPTYDPTTGGWGGFNGASQTCDPTIQVKLQQAALAGSQITRAISDRQLAYSQIDPIEAVNNPRKDGAGGVCTLDFFAFDLGRLLGSTYDQIKHLIDTLSSFSVDSLFGAACKVVNSIFGSMQNQLLAELQTNSPLTPFQQFVNAIQVGYIAPAASFAAHSAAVRSTTAALPGLVTGNPLQVSYVPGKGYVYMADMGGNLLVVNISQTPLAPADTIAPAQ